MASEAFGDNMLMDNRVFEVADFKSEVMCLPGSFGGHHGLGGCHGL